MSPSSLTAAVAALLALAAAGGVAADTLHAPPPPGWVSAGAHPVKGGLVEDFRPAGQTPARWDRLYTVQRKFGDGGMASSTFVGFLAKGYLDRCPRGGRYDVVHMGREAGVRIDCSSTNLTIFARAIQGAKDMHVVQFAFKGMIVLPDDAQRARDRLGAAYVTP